MQALVLSKKDFREFDQLITLYTKDQGKIELLSRGSKKIISKQASFLMPFSCVEIEVVSGQEIDHLIRTQPINIFKKIRSDVYKSLLSEYVVKLVDQVTGVNEKDERVFSLLVTFFLFIDGTDSVQDTILLGFIAQFLRLLGFMPVLDQCLWGGEKLEEIEHQQALYFSPSAGGIICERCRMQLAKPEILLSISFADIKNITLLYSDDLDKVSRVSCSFEVKNSLYQFMVYQTERKVPNWFNFSKTLA
jgi:DNA repair protein RecO (recombination protein O)